MKKTVYVLVAMLLFSFSFSAVSAKNNIQKEEKLTVVAKVEDISKVAPEEDRKNKDKKLKKATDCNRKKKSGCCSSATSCTEVQTRSCAASKKNCTKNKVEKH